MDYEEMLEFVRKTLEAANSIKPDNPYHAFRDRAAHSKRVYGWALRIIDDLDCDKEVVLTACIFHDVGYSVEKKNHAMYSERIFNAYARSHGFDEGFRKKVASIIALHSDKTLLKDPNSSPELILLLEADLLDEEGALGIAWDLLARGSKGAREYADSLEALKIHSGHILNQNYMITPRAIEIWEHKKALVRSFIAELEYDLFLEDKNGF